MTRSNPECLVAVVVTHDRLKKLRVTIGRLLDSPPRDLAAVLVVDNASSDGTRDWLDAQQDPQLEVLHSARNLGGAGGFEWGMRQAVALFDPAWVVVMDDDARPAPGALAEFHRRDKSGINAVAAARLLRHADARTRRIPFAPFQLTKRIRCARST